MDSPQKQELLTKFDMDEDDEYLQVLDAGEHVYSMFVSEDEDIYRYIGIEVPSPSWTVFPNSEDIEDIISRSIVPSLDMQHKQCVEQDCCCDSIADMDIKGTNDGAEGEEISCNNRDNANPRRRPRRSGCDERVNSTIQQIQDEACGYVSE